METALIFAIFYLAVGACVAALVRNVGPWHCRVDDGPIIKSVLIRPVHLAGWLLNRKGADPDNADKALPWEAC